jgi:ribosomal protein L7Ae-like RNA K-turn-binding protein
MPAAKDAARPRQAAIAKGVQFVNNQVRRDAAKLVALAAAAVDGSSGA